MSDRVRLFEKLFGPGFVSLRVNVDGAATLSTSRNEEVRFTGFDRAEVARMARKLAGVCHLTLVGFGGGMAQLTIKKADLSVNLYWDRRGNKPSISQCRNWKSF